jgi:CelD/BcsL family acetyltransferase involved in cellulose biosynthesis
MIMALRDRTTIYGYLSGFDPEFAPLGVGREVLVQAIRYAHSHAYRWWDFLRGDEPYKLLWGAELILKRKLCFDRGE